MLESIKNWKGAVEVDGTHYSSVEDLPSSLVLTDSMHILLTNEKNVSAASAPQSVDSALYSIEVKSYMTKKATPEFDFMEKWNNNVPMPLRVMVGTIEKETPRMVKMKLHGDILQDRILCCMKCGRKLDNPVSQYFGMGPECGGHAYVNPFDSEEELHEAVDSYRKQLQDITWEGWIIKSAILKQEEIDGNK